jgi:adenylosuccinate synthase
MSLWVVVGGQFGSEGKGKVAAYLTLTEDINLCVRCGGPNSGHSFTGESGNEHLVRQIPTGFINKTTRLLIPAGGLIDLAVLKQEIDLLGLEPSRLGIDNNAMIIEEQDRTREKELRLQQRLSSTLCGVGSAVARRALREDTVRLAYQAGKECSWLKDYLTNVALECNQASDQGKKILIEGTQGYGLSLYHSEYYPKSTSRDTTAAAFLSEVGLSPALVTEIVLVFRTFPIRVAGEQAGPMKNEIDWDILQRESHYPHQVHEITSVTRKIRRVARFDWELAEQAIRANRPTKIAMNGIDYLNFLNRGVTVEEQLSEEAHDFIFRFKERLKTKISLLGTGPSVSNFILHSEIGNTCIGNLSTR